MRRFALAAWCILLAAACTGPARAEAVRNGNELALALVEADAAGKAQLQKAHTGVIHTFRFLKITAIAPACETHPVARVETIEPSSDARVTLFVTRKLSLDVLAQLKPGDGVGIRGRLRKIALGTPNAFEVEAVIEFKDKLQPARGKELLREVDQQAH
jgi:hypothetical protein